MWLLNYALRKNPVWEQYVVRRGRYSNQEQVINLLQKNTQNETVLQCRSLVDFVN